MVERAPVEMYEGRAWRYAAASPDIEFGTPAQTCGGARFREQLYASEPLQKCEPPGKASQLARPKCAVRVLRSL